ncbi:MAG: hypothetical protein IT381_27130 [Deltaproteobacteria bacterium]|nr:hypothetical protein [Deltaproteobacteria bacterium]
MIALPVVLALVAIAMIALAVEREGAAYEAWYSTAAIEPVNDEFVELLWHEFEHERPMVLGPITTWTFVSAFASGDIPHVDGEALVSFLAQLTIFAEEQRIQNLTRHFRNAARAMWLSRHSTPASAAAALWAVYYAGGAKELFDRPFSSLSVTELAHVVAWGKNPSWSRECNMIRGHAERLLQRTRFALEPVEFRDGHPCARQHNDSP